jgi:hypothetical protein
MKADSLVLSANVIGHYRCSIFACHARLHHGSTSVCSASGLPKMRWKTASNRGKGSFGCLILAYAKGPRELWSDPSRLRGRQSVPDFQTAG